jgi:hypothetical protein
MRRDPAKAILVLDAMLEFFEGGRRWIDGILRDDITNKRCLVGALHYVRQQQRIHGAGTEHYLHMALPSIVRKFLEPGFVEIFNYDKPTTPDNDLMSFNDEFDGFDHVHALIIEARAIAQGELENVHERPHRYRSIRQSRAEGRISGDPRHPIHDAPRAATSERSHQGDALPAA